MAIEVSGVRAFGKMCDALVEDVGGSGKATWMIRTHKQVGEFVKAKILALPAYSHALLFGGLKGKRPAIPQNFVPKRTGKLRGSLKLGKPDNKGFTLGLGAVYAGPIHYGWPARNIPEQPFITDTIERLEGEIEDRYRRAWNKRKEERIRKQVLAAHQERGTGGRFA